MSATEHIIDALTRHQVFQQRYAGGLINDLMPIFDDMKESIEARLAAGVTEFQSGRLRQLSAAIEEIIRTADAQFAEQLIEQLELFAEYEAEFTQRVLNEVVTIDMALPSAQQIIASVTNAQMQLVTGQNIQRMTIPQMLEKFDSNKQGEIRRTIQRGFIEGTTSQDLTRDISRMVEARTKQQAGSIVRTAVNHMSTVARQATINENADIIKEVRWISTLDARTTLVCMSRDQRVYPVDRGPRPPAHYSCRSTVIPIIDPAFTIPGLKGERASMNGPVDDKTTYNSWLKRQTVEFQDEVLGKERAKLFRNGGLHLSKFTDDSGITYNLSDLKRLYPIETARAGLE